MSDGNRDEKLGKAIAISAYLWFAVKFILVVSLISLAVLWFLDKPLWIAPIAGIVLFLIYRFIRTLVLRLLISWGRKSSGEDK